MNKAIAVFYFFIFNINGAYGLEKVEDYGFDQNVTVPPYLTSESNSKLSQNYSETKCKNFFFKKIKIGFVCVSLNSALATDFGVTLPGADGNSDHTNDDEPIIVATGTSSYEMKALNFPNYDKSAYAEVDCDEENGPVYRPTSTCFIFVGIKNQTTYFYGNFLIKNHKKKTDYLTVTQAEAIFSK